MSLHVCPHLGIHLCCHNYLNVMFKHLFQCLKKAEWLWWQLQLPAGRDCYILYICVYTQVDQKFISKTPKIILFCRLSTGKVSWDCCCIWGAAFQDGKWIICGSPKELEGDEQEAKNYLLFREFDGIWIASGKPY